MKASEAWKKAVNAEPQLFAVCPFCKTLNYASGNPDLWQEGELGKMHVRSGGGIQVQEHEDKDQLEVGELEGKKVVFGCNCERLETFERWLWNSRHEIVDYIALRAEGLEEEGRGLAEKATRAKAKLSAVKGGKV